MTLTIWIGIAACIAGIAAVRQVLRRRHPDEAGNMGSVSQHWVAEHQVGRTEDGGLR